MGRILGMTSEMGITLLDVGDNAVDKVDLLFWPERCSTSTFSDFLTAPVFAL